MHFSIWCFFCCSISEYEEPEIENPEASRMWVTFILLLDLSTF